MHDSEPRVDVSPSPLWLRLLGGVVLALMGAGLLYAVAIGLQNAGRIGV